MRQEGWAEDGDGWGAEEQQRTRIAWLYYVEGQTQAEIAQRLGINRIKVNRELAICRDTGLVQIRINGRLASCVERERALERRYRLKEAIVVPSPTPGRELYQTLGMATGNWVSDRLRPGQTIAIGWGRTLLWSVRSIRRRQLGGITVVSLLGGLGRGSEINTYETASRFAEALGAQCYYMAAPTYASTPELRDMLMEQAGVAENYARGRKADLAVVSVGSLAPGSTMRNLGLLTENEIASLNAAGAVGDLLGHWIDARGQVIDHPLNRRVVGLPPGDLARLPVAALASGGPTKAQAIRGALLGRYCNVLITDEDTAALLLED